MITTTTETIPNKEITEILGIARDGAVRAKSVASALWLDLKTLLVEN